MKDPAHRVQVDHFHDSREFYHRAAACVGEHMARAIEARGQCTVALAGGQTPKALYKILATMEEIDWSRVHLFWGDERCVPATHPDSNFNMAKRILLSKVSIPDKNIHRVKTEDVTPAEAARLYERELELFFTDALPSFDIVLLGVGRDGHTASLFPGDRALQEQQRTVVSVSRENGWPRVTFTLPVLNNARTVIFLVADERKTNIVDEIVSDRAEAAKRYPAAMVQPKGELLWNILSSA